MQHRSCRELYQADGRIAVSPAPAVGQYSVVAEVRKLDAACQPVQASGGPVDGSSEANWQAQSDWIKSFAPSYASDYFQDEDDGWVSFELHFPTGTISGSARVPPLADLSRVPGVDQSCSQRSLPAPQGCGP